MWRGGGGDTNEVRYCIARLTDMKMRPWCLHACTWACLPLFLVSSVPVFYLRDVHSKIMSSFEVECLISVLYIVFFQQWELFICWFKPCSSLSVFHRMVKFISAGAVCSLMAVITGFSQGRLIELAKEAVAADGWVTSLVGSWS